MPPQPLSAPHEHADHDDHDDHDVDERQARITAVLLGAVALVEVGGALARGAHGPIDLMFHAAVVLPSAGFAIALLRGLRPRAGIIVFALLWSILSIAAAATAKRMFEAFPDATPLADRHLGAQAASTWFVWLVRVVWARAVCFSAAVIVLDTGRPGRGRRRAGAALAAVFLAIFVAEQVFQARG